MLKPIFRTSFQSTPSVGRATGLGGKFETDDKISIHALRGEGDPPFNSNSPNKSGNNFNPRPPWGGRRHENKAVLDKLAISIHALRGEGDIRLEVK